MRGIDKNARSRKSAILAAATVSALTLAIPGTAFAYCSGSGSSNKTSDSGDHVSGTTASWDKDWRRDHHGTPPTTVKGSSNGGDDRDHDRKTGTCVIDVPTSDQKDGIHQIIIKNGDGGYHVIFVDGSAVPGHYKPCFPLTHPAGDKDNKDKDHDNNGGNGHGSTTTTARPTTTTSTSTTSTTLENQPSVQGESLTASGVAPVNGGSTTTTSTTAPGAKVLGESITATPAGTSSGTGAASTDPGSVPASVLAQDVSSSPSTLAFTGADVAELTGIGLVLVGIGGATLLARRRSSDADAK